MTIRAVLNARLTGFAGLSALIGARAYHVRAPQGVVTPFITFERISEVREAAFGQWIDALTSRYQIDVYASSAASCTTVSEQVVAAFKTWRDAASSPVIFGAHVENVQGPLVDDLDISRVIIDLIIDHREE